MEAQITIDDRIGSKELEEPLFCLGLTTQVRRIPYGDFTWMGYGPQGYGPYGVERKRVRDVLQSMETGRFFGHQAPGLIAAYPGTAYMIMEGYHRPNPRTTILEELVRNGWRALTVGSTQRSYTVLDNFLNTVAATPIRVKISDTPEETALQIKNLYDWSQKPWDQHQSAKVIYNQGPTLAVYGKQTLARRFAALLYKIGWEKSAKVVEHFPTVLDMVLATKQDWMQIEGIGPTIADRAVREIQGELFNDKE